MRIGYVAAGNLQLMLAGRVPQFKSAVCGGLLAKLTTIAVLEIPNDRCIEPSSAVNRVGVVYLSPKSAITGRTGGQAGTAQIINRGLIIRQ